MNQGTKLEARGTASLYITKTAKCLSHSPFRKQNSEFWFFKLTQVLFFYRVEVLDLITSNSKNECCIHEGESPAHRVWSRNRLPSRRIFLWGGRRVGMRGERGRGKIPYMWRHTVFGFMAAVVWKWFVEFFFFLLFLVWSGVRIVLFWIKKKEFDFRGKV